MSQHVLFARSRAGDGRRTHRSRKNVSGYDNNDLGGRIELLQGKTAHASKINWRGCNFGVEGVLTQQNNNQQAYTSA